MMTLQEIFGVDKSLSSHTESCKKVILILGEGDTFGINGSFGAPENRSNINFSKLKTKFCFSSNLMLTIVAYL